LGVAEEVHRGPPAGLPHRQFSLNDVPVCGRLVEGGTDDRLRDFVGAHRTSSNDWTTCNSLPRSSMTLTATVPCGSASNGALVEPARWSQTPSPNVAFRHFFRLSQAPVRGKNAWQTWKHRPL